MKKETVTKSDILEAIRGFSEKMKAFSQDRDLSSKEVATNIRKDMSDSHATSL